MRSLKRPEPPPIDPYKAQPLPIHRPISVYYRQSSEGQVGNVSTTLQTVDMVDHLEHLGWVRDRIWMTDMDAGVSGTKKIKDRPGMSHVFDLIEHGQIGAVAAQDVDRFFRDVTQIETNIFIDACKRHNVLVLTPNVVFDFAHPVLGPSHIKMFREEAQRAADYLEYQVRGRLVKSRHRWSEHGCWAGRKIAPGFMVDMRDTLPDGSRNPDYRKFVKFEPWADVVLAYFSLFRTNDGNLEKTWRDIEANGPAFPPVAADQIPKGFIWRTQRKLRSPVTGQLMPSNAGLHYMFTNVAYIGHWIHKQAIVRWNNHEAILPLDLFMYAYNRISPTNFLGDPNTDYVPYRPWVRHHKEDRQVEPPTYAYLIYTDDLPDRPHKQLASVWNTWANLYQYQVVASAHKSNYWNIRAHIVDRVVDRMLLERLKATTLDEAAWQQAIASIDHGDHAEVRRIETAIRTAKQTKDNLIASLGTLTNPDMVKRAQAHYEAADGEIAMLTAELARIHGSNRRSLSLVQARPALEQIIARWDEVPRQERRTLFEEFGEYIHITKLNRSTKRITVHWRDETTASYEVTRESRGYFWDEEDLDLLRELVEGNADQIEILRTFPQYTWRALQERYVYNFGGGHWPKSYSGQRPYNRLTRWADTEEAKAEAQPETSMASTDRLQ